MCKERVQSKKERRMDEDRRGKGQKEAELQSGYPTFDFLLRKKGYITVSNAIEVEIRKGGGVIKEDILEGTGMTFIEAYCTNW